MLLAQAAMLLVAMAFGGGGALAQTAAPTGLEPAAAEPSKVAILQGLDKVTARISTFEAPVGVKVRFGTLEIVVRDCRKRPPEEPPEVFVFLQIDEIQRGEDPKRLFSGWMFASSPALSALEHPVYDVWAVDCRNSSSSDDVNSR
jgi:hypothetical protein